MKITFVLDTFGGGGKERRCLQLIQGLNKRGYKNIQVIIINNDIAYNALYETNINLHIIDRKNKGLNFIQTCRTIYVLLKQFQPDVVQVWGILSAFYLNIISRLMSFKYIGAYVADCNKSKIFSIERLVVFINSILAESIVGNSEAGIAAYRIPQKKAKVIYNGFNEERLINNLINKEDLKNELNIKSKFIVTMIARFDEGKDYKTFLEAANIILKIRSDITFLCVGDGPKLSQHISENTRSGSDNIIFMGFRNDVEKILQISNISVLCSNPIKHKEGISNSILESMAFGVPVIATNSGGTPEIVEHGSNGYLVNKYDSQDIAEKIIKIISDSKHYKSLSIATKKTVQRKFTLEKMINDFDKLYISFKN